MASSVVSPHESGPSDRLEGLSEAHLRTLIRVSQAFNSTMDLDELLPRILEMALDVLGAEVASVWVVEGSGVQCLGSAGEIGDALAGVSLPLGAGFAGWVVARGEPALVEEASADERYLHQLDAATGFETGSVLCVPLVSKEGVIGALEVANERGDGDRFDRGQLAFLTALADDAAAAVRNARLYEAERRARDLKSLLSFTHDIAATLEPDRIHLSVVNLAGEAVPFERCVLAVWDGEELVVRAVSGQEQVDRRARAIREVEQLLLWAAEKPSPLRVDDMQQAEGLPTQLRERFGAYLEGAGARSLLIIRLEDGEGPVGMLLFESASVGTYAGWREEAASLVAAAATLSLRNAQLYAGVPFISWLEPLARRRRSLAALPRGVRAAWGLALVALVAILLLVRLPLRVSAEGAELRAAVQRPAYAGAGGIVETVLVREGERVSAGEPVARLRDDERLLRMRELEAEEAVARREVLAAEAVGAAAATAAARIREARASDALGLLRQEEERAVVRAPVDGVVLTPRVEERAGTRVEAGAPLLWVGDARWAEVELTVPVREVGELEVGQRVRARVDAYPDVTFEGRLGALAPAIRDSGEAPVFTARAMLDNGAGLLRPGMAAHVKVLTEPRPLAVLFFRRPWRWLRLRLWWLLPS